MPRLACPLAVLLLSGAVAAAEPLPGTAPLETRADLASEMVSGIDAYLNRKLDESVAGRRQYWRPDFASAEAYRKSVEPNRERFRQIIGAVDARVGTPALEMLASTDQPAVLIAQNDRVRVYGVRWQVLPGMDAEGLLLQPTHTAKLCVVALPDADQTPEMIAGLAEDPTGVRPFARTLAENGCQVLVPTLIDRQDTWSGNPKIRRTNQPHREWVYRMAYEMGRHVIGYEVQKVLAAVDWFAREQNRPPVAVCGYGEGGLLALYAGALDPRIDVVGVSGYFGPRERVWAEPIYRNVWGLLKEFGDAELAALIAPRPLVIEDVPGPKVEGPPAPREGRTGAAPGGTLHRFEGDTGAAAEVQRAKGLAFEKLGAADRLKLVRPKQAGSNEWVRELLAAAGNAGGKLAPVSEPLADQRKDFDPSVRQKRQFDQAVAFTQNLLPTAVDRRNQFWSKMDTSSVEKFQASTQPYRDHFHDEVVGRLPRSTAPLRPRSRLAYDTPKWKGYEVVLDMDGGVICYGILLVPKDLTPGEKRPVVVCQHGLEGRPQDVCNPDEKTRAYNSFGAQLANLGYVVFAPQNPYIFQDRFRVLNRKGNPLKLSIYSFIVEQHERIIDWLETLPFVDSRRIAYYGLSYGGKVAMRIGALVTRYCAVICSGDFNEWVWKNVNVVWRGSYMFTFEYEMYEFNLGDTFNYAEMARLIAPRPFMVERGHDDGVGLDEWVAYEYGRVRYLYARQLRLPERAEIEFFPGVHEIHGVGTFRFLRRHLNWPAGE